MCGRWYPVVQELQRFFVAISRAVVNIDGAAGTQSGLLVPFREGGGLCTLFVMLLCYLGLHRFEILSGLVFFLVPSLRMMSVIGRITLVFWSS